MCISTSPAPVSRTSGSVPGSAAALTSFTMEAPASIAARATSARRVSTLIGVSGDAARKPSITGTTRSISSAGSTGSAPGRVDSPPTSRMSAPSATKAKTVLHGVVDAAEHAAVTEGVRGHVDDAHDQRSFPQWEHVLAAAPDVVAQQANRGRIRR